MRLIAALCLVSTLGVWGCAAPIAEYRAPAPIEPVANCNPDYPCANSYYWDEWREVYVYYDGYRYIDCTGLPGGYPLPPIGIIYTAVPPGYVPPTAWIPARGTYHPPHGFVPRGGPAPLLPVYTNLLPPQIRPYYYGAPPPQPTAPYSYGAPANGGYVGPQNPNRYGEPNRPAQALPPPPPVTSRGEVLEPARDPRPSAYGAPPPPASQATPQRYAEPVEPARGGYVPPPQQPVRQYQQPERAPEGRSNFQNAPPPAAAEVRQPERPPTNNEQAREPVNERTEQVPPPQAAPQNTKKPPPPPPPPHGAAAPVHAAPAAPVH